VGLVRTDVLEECVTSIIRVKRIWELGTMLAVNNVVPCSLIIFILMMEATYSSETSVLTRATWRHIAEDDILQDVKQSLTE
jgi:hypothetical protein